MRETDSLFLTGTGESGDAFREAVRLAGEVIVRYFAKRDKPYSGLAPTELRELWVDAGHGAIPLNGEQLETIMERVGEVVLRNSAIVTHPACAAHLHCPPLVASIAAELLIAATNQSMDSWDQSMAATFVEEELVHWLCSLFRYSETGDGVFTSGGTQSNLMGLLLARDAAISARFNWNVQRQGLPSGAGKLRILCSEAAHFSISQSAALLGLGQQAVVSVKTDSRYRMCMEDLDVQLERLSREGSIPFLIVATAGTTDYGSIDPLGGISARAKSHGLWLHVDAAYGGALMLSQEHQAKLFGIEAADSITVDFHKLFYQPISCGAFLLKDRSQFQWMRLHADYLNPQDEAENTPNLVGKSLQTTRRFDALKLYMSLRHVGLRIFGEMIDYTVELAVRFAERIKGHSDFELLHEPELNAVVFRYLPQGTPPGKESAVWTDTVNAHIRSELLRRGEAVLARTKNAGRCCLKVTLLNPATTIADLEQLLEKAEQIGSHYQLEKVR
ncbi:pyridoxal phosphate-dependent decarboxylase family protein [Paenibacillus sp. GCM10027627]|uniref:pyridoxal phosphate-dependent decarboxylase family protein n=1 Tax=unclassified Paenibacillus TaxID=185978 RepID=UPI00363FED4E